VAVRTVERLNAEKDKTSVPAGFLRPALNMIDMQARLRVAATAGAVEPCRVRHGRWPQRLDDLPEGPLADPFDGQPLRYKVTPAGRMVYSIGQDLRDDGGEASRQGTDGDLIFHLFDLSRRNHPRGP
jgi:hypothetical protein